MRVWMKGGVLMIMPTRLWGPSAPTSRSQCSVLPSVNATICAAMFKSCTAQSTGLTLMGATSDKSRTLDGRQSSAADPSQAHESEPLNQLGTARGTHDLSAIGASAARYPRTTKSHCAAQHLHGFVVTEANSRVQAVRFSPHVRRQRSRLRRHVALGVRPGDAMHFAEVI